MSGGEGYFRVRSDFGAELVVVDPRLLPRFAHLSAGRYETLSVAQAEHALRRAVQVNRPLLAALYRCFRGGGLLENDRDMLEELRYKLGHVFPGDSDPPASARMVVLRERLGQQRKAEKLPELPPPREIDKRRLSFIVIQTVDPRDVAVPSVRCEVILPDGDVRSVTTDALGNALLENIPAGTCQLRLASLDGSSWRTDSGESSQVDKGYARQHDVKQGECLALICHRYGIRDWQRVWSDAANTALRDRRRDPNVLLPGDALIIPPIQIHQVAAATDRTHKIVITEEDLELRVRLQDRSKRALTQLEYELIYLDGERQVERPGVAPTDANGVLSERLPLRVQVVYVRLKKSKLSFEFLINQLDPSFEPATKQGIESGIAARLRGLGYGASGPVDEIAAFQRQELGRNAPSGEADEETCRKLEEQFGV